jgi:hypothetical protein
MQKHNTMYQLVSIKRDTSHTTKIWRKVIIQTETPDPTLERKRQELESLNEQIKGMTFNPIYRPPASASNPKERDFMARDTTHSHQVISWVSVEFSRCVAPELCVLEAHGDILPTSQPAPAVQYRRQT